MSKSHSELVITGPEWKGLCEIISIVLGNDDLFRESGKTLLWNRGQVEAARDELNRAAQRGKSWILYVLREGSDHIIRIKTRNPNRHEELLFPNEKIVLSAPEHIRVEATPKVLTGIANACCKVMGLHDAVKDERGEELLTEHGYALAKRFWNRCHLHWRKSVGASKAAWKRKGYIAKYEEVPDYRNPDFHEGAKLLYELGEVPEEEKD